jgi:HK97 family phage major capsid protein
MDKDLTDSLLSIKTGVETYGGKLAAMQTQIDAIDQRTGEHPFGVPLDRKSLAKHLEESDQFKRLLSDRRGIARLVLRGNDAAAFAQKTTITSSGPGYQPVSGVLQIDRIQGITLEPRAQLTLRSLLTARPTTYQVIDFVKVLSPMVIASPVPETSLKPENQVTFAPTSERVKTIATWIPATRQILDDFTELAGFINTSLSYYVNLAEEQQLLSGDGTGENLHGLIPQATTFNSGLLNNTAGWNRMDVVGRAVEQLMAAKELTPSFVVMHPNDWWAIRLTKDSLGRYILGDPQQSAQSRLWDLDVVATTSIALGSFLVGSGDPAAAEIRDRLELMVEVSTEHADYFVRNLVAIRCEKRLALIVKRPGSFVTGNLTSSPAS